MSDQAAAVFQETKSIISRQNELRKLVSQKNAAAYEESQRHLGRLVEILGKENGQHVQMNNREIMFNLGLHRIILDTFIFGLPLERDTSRRNHGRQAMDTAKDPRLRDLLQRAYDVLRELVRGFAKAQQACIPLFTSIQQHVGIEKLNVVDTVVEILRDRTGLWLHVQNSICEEMVTAVKTYGRRSRWLNFLQVFCEIKGVWVPVVKPFQAKIFRLLLQDKDLLLDLNLDYTNSPFLPRDDPRYGKTAFQLLQDQDYKQAYFSLANYHAASLNILALCCAGKNRVIQASTCQLIPLSNILVKILQLGQPPSGGSVDAIRDCDAIHHVKRGWARLLLEAYLKSTECARECELVQRHHEMILSSERNCLMREISRGFRRLSKRLEGFRPDQAHDISMLSGKGDEAGDDILLHIEYAQFCIEIAQRLFTSVFSRHQFFEIQKGLPAIYQQLKKELEHSVHDLYQVTQGPPMYRQFSNSLVELLSHISKGNPGLSIRSVSPALRTGRSHSERTEKFLTGWNLLRGHLQNVLKVPSVDGRSSHTEVRDIAMMFGSSISENDDRKPLRQLMDLLREKEQKDLKLLEAGLRVLRAILYLNPDELNEEERDREYQLFLKNEHPTDSADMKPRFTLLQTKLARMGAVDVILSCLPYPDKAVVSATLKLAAIMVDGGNDSVQSIFHRKLATSDGNRFFEKLHLLFEEAIAEIKESKRRMKRRARTLEELNKAGIDPTVHEFDHGESENHRESEEYMAEVMKMMRSLS